jgi:hypothetical protein
VPGELESSVVSVLCRPLYNDQQQDVSPILLYAPPTGSAYIRGGGQDVKSDLHNSQPMTSCTFLTPPETPRLAAAANRRTHRFPNTRSRAARSAVCAAAAAESVVPKVRHSSFP